MAPRMLVLKRADVCVACGFDLPAGATAWWDGRARAVTCATCQEAKAQPAPEPPPVALDRGQAGASVAREHDRRRLTRETQVREAHPRIGGLLLAVGQAPQRERAFRQGQLGEEAVGALLDKRTANGPGEVLHDRGMPGGRGNIDHLAVVPCGVFVIDAKQYSGKARVVDGGFRGARLVIAERDRTRLIDGLDRQVRVVRSVLAAHGDAGVPVHGVLCFTTADLPRLKTLEIRGHLLLTRRALGRRLDAEGPLSAPDIAALVGVLGTALPSA
jgi:hypothetical protein